MNRLYQIRDWNLYFENNKSRERDRLTWCAIPNKQDGLEYRSLMGMESGEAMYGAFVAVVLVASKQKRPRDGHLTGTGRADGRPYTPRELALKTSVSEATIARMLAVCSSQSVYWIDTYIEGVLQVPAECPFGALAMPAECPPSVQERKERKEGKERKKEMPEASLSPQDPSSQERHQAFEAWWKFYRDRTGRGTDKQDTVESYLRLSDEEQAGLMAWTLAWFEKRDKLAGAKVFVAEPPDPKRFIRKKRWNDELSLPSVRPALPSQPDAVREQWARAGKGVEGGEK